MMIAIVYNAGSTVAVSHQLQITNNAILHIHFTQLHPAPTGNVRRQPSLVWHPMVFVLTNLIFKFPHPSQETFSRH